VIPASEYAPGALGGARLVVDASQDEEINRLSWQESAALPLAGLTAWRAVHTCARVGSGTVVLVTGAGSGVSTFVLQLAVAAGAKVVTTTGARAKLERAVELGAAGGVLYTDRDWPEQVRRLAGPIDAVVDSYGGEALSRGLSLLGRGGRYVSFGDTGGPAAKIELADVYWEWRSIVGTTMGSPKEFDALIEHVGSAGWRPVIDSVYPLEQLPDAAARLASSERFGKVVIDVA